jgi:putative Holliday junction resolvase
MPERSSPETIVAFDFGLRRIGVAVGQDVTGSASPLGIVSNGANGPDFDHIAALVKEWRPVRLVVGMPLHLDDSPGDLEPTIREFVAALERFKLPIERVDERHTSQEAERVLKNARQSGNRGRIKKEHVDSAAAVLIAERYLSMAGCSDYK